MVQAILAGNKTQTRRVVKHKVEGDNCTVIEKLSPPRINVRDPRFLQFCPYGQVGDFLWVRETFSQVVNLGVDKNGNIASELFSYNYKANLTAPIGGYWKPSIHMPRAASRILLEITGVRIERLHSISKQDAIAEGIKQIKINCSRDGEKIAYKAYDWPNENITKNNPIDSYFSLWESINGRESLESNPWVWVITFKVVEVKQ